MNRNPSPVLGTCRWIIDHQHYQNWWQSQSSSLLWISADAGCGKSVLTSFLIGHLKSPETRIEIPQCVCYFFFKDDNDQQKSAIYAISAILHQLYAQQPALLNHAFTEYQQKGPPVFDQFHTLWRVLMKSIEDVDLQGDVICILDGLDECDPISRQQLLTSLSTFYSRKRGAPERGPFLKTLIASRPDNDIKTAFHKLPEIRLRGEDEVDAISKDVALVVQASMDDIIDQGIPRDIMQDLQVALINRADRTFLWTTMIIDLLKDAAKRGASKTEMTAILASTDIFSIYHRLLNNSADIVQARKLLCIIIAATRPLKLQELNAALAIHSTHKSFADLESERRHPFDNYIKYLCGNFLRIIHSTVYFVHQTARDFLLHNAEIHTSSKVDSWQHSITPRGAHHVLLNSCVWYLELLSSAKSFYFRGSTAEDLYGFIEYAACHWPTHFRETAHDVDADIVARCAHLCNPKIKCFPIWFGKYFLYNPSHEKYSDFLCRPTDLEVATLLCLDEVLDYIETQETTSTDGHLLLIEEHDLEYLQMPDIESIEDLKDLVWEMKSELALKGGPLAESSSMERVSNNGIILINNLK
jgi:hypothetical protein